MKAIITGGAIRVGKAVSLALAKHGYDIVLIYNSSKDEAEATAKEIKNLEKECFTYKCDLKNKKEFDKVFKEILTEFNDIKLLVNNASIFEQYDFASTTEDIYDRHMDINLKAPFFISQAFTNYIEKNKAKGHIVNVLDSWAESNDGSHFAYLLSKKGLLDLTMMMARNLGPNIRINAVSLGAVLPSKDFDESWINEKSKKMPLQKRAGLDEVTDAIIKLDESKYLTGQNIHIDSGWHLV